jgi:quercetin dioxygenase-like cupin family protein
VILPLTADESKARGAFLISRSATLRSPFRTEKLGLFETNAVPPASAYSEISKFPNPFCFDHPIARMMKTTLSILFLLLFPLVLFAKDKAAPTREKLTVSTEAWTGQKLPAYPSGQPEISILKITIPPGQRLPMHKHPVINAAVVLRGELTVTTDKGKVFHVKAGHPMVEVVNEWHYGANHGTEPLELIAFYAGVKGTPITVPQK